ncbi:MAG: C25 family cysteine peptidase, partial [bacterium]
MAPAVVAAYTIDLEYGWNSTDMEFKQVGAFDFLGVSGSRYPETSVGSIREVRLLPAGYRMLGYEIVSEKWEAVQGNFRPGKVSLDGLVDLEGDSPGGLISIESGNIMGYSVLVSEVQPVRLTSGGTSLLKQLRVRVDVDPDDGTGMRPRRRSSHMDMHVRSMLEAYLGESLDGYGDWRVEAPGEWISDGPGRNGSTVDCVIITADNLKPEFERLADWHDRLGMRTVVRTVDWVRQRYPGMDGAEQVRNFIKDAYQNWGTVYVILGGDTHIVPIRMIDVPRMKENIGRTEMPTDVYYANLDGNWNANGNSLIGEYDAYLDDKIDFYTDVMVGRALVNSPAEARIFVDKTVHYASGSNRGVWQRTALSLAQQLFTHLDGAYWSEQILEHFPVTWQSKRLYQSYQDYPGSVEENVENALAYMDSGCNIMSHIGHGDELRLDLGNEFMERFQLEGLRNDTAYSFVYMMNCSSSDPRVESVGKALTKNPNGGAFAVIGNSSLAFPGLGLPMEEYFFELIFSEGQPSIGAVSAFYRQPFSPNDPLTPTRLWMYLNYLLVGDPTVRLWQDEARTAQIVAPSQVALSDTIVSVEVRDEGIPAAGAVVTLLGERDEYGVGVTGTDGVANVKFRPRGPGWVDVVVSGAGFAVGEDSLQVTGSGGHLYVSGLAVDVGYTETSNYDGRAGWGERLELGVSLVNGGTGTLDGVTADLRSIPACSLTVSVETDSLMSADDIFVGKNCQHPSTIPFPLVAGEGTLGRCGREQQDQSGCWIWLDAMGWHVRFMGDGEAHTYACTLQVHGEMVGHSGHALEEGDIITSGGGEIVLEGDLTAGDFEDGLDLVLGMDGSVVIHDGQASYGTVGSSEVTGWYDVEFLPGGVGDGLGVWYELSISDGAGGSWTDWFQVEVHDGDLIGERVEFASLGGDTTGVIYGLRNSGGGALSGVEGRLRALSGAEVTDSLSAYGEICAGCYSSGDYYRVRELGGPVSYEVFVQDIFGRVWRDTIDVRTVEPCSGLTWTVS